MATKKGSVPTLDNKGRVFVSSFEENLKRYALVTKDNRINVYDTAAGTMRVQCFNSTSSSKQFNNQYTSIAWGKANVKLSKGERGGANDIVVGANNGAIHIWDVLTSDIVLSLGEKGEGHVGAVNGVVVHALSTSGVALFSCGADGQVIQWDLKGKKVATKWKANATAVSRLAVHISSELGLVATADTTIKVWDLSSQKTLIKFAADRVTNLQFTHDGEYLLSTGTDRVIKMWSCKQSDISANKQTATREFACDSVPLSLKLNKKHGLKQSYHFLAITEGGLLNVFETSSSSKGGISPASCVARLDTSQPSTDKSNGAAKAKDSVTHTLVDAHFWDTKELVVVLGPETAPVFQRVNYANEDGTLLKQCTIPIKQATEKSATQNKKAKVTTLEATSIPPPNVVEGKKTKSERTIASIDSKKIAAVEQVAKDANAANSNSVTFQSALEQAIHTNDQQLLNKCLSISNFEMIKSTLLRLAPSFIIPLVKLMITILHSESHHQALFSYLHIIIGHHTALLMSSGALRECSALYSAINARSACYLDLVKTKGRIDLFLSHLDQAQAAVVVDTNPKNVYKEVKEESGSESDASDAEMEDEKEEGEEGESEGEGEGESEESEEEEEGDEFIKVNGKDSDEEEEAGNESSDDGSTKNKRKRDDESDESNDDDDGSEDDEDD